MTVSDLRQQKLSKWVCGWTSVRCRLIWLSAVITVHGRLDVGWGQTAPRERRRGRRGDGYVDVMKLQKTSVKAVGYSELGASRYGVIIDL